MTRPIAVLFCPGRGAYARGELGFLGRTLAPGPVAEALDRADAARRDEGRPGLRELDGAPRFQPGLHLEGRNAAELIAVATLAHVERLRERYDIVAIGGNSLGWYTALAAAGCLTPDDGLHLTATMARLQRGVAGGQVLTTTLDRDWQPDPELCAAVDRALETANALGEGHFVARSIRLGGHEVLAGTEPGVQHLLRELPKVETTDRELPFRLAGHGPFHTVLCREVAAAACDELRDLVLAPPAVHLIDGRGNVHTPWSADPSELLHYTTAIQVVTTFDFTACVRTAIREFNPDVLLCAGPGTTLRAPVGHVVLREGYRGLRSKEELFAAGLVRIDSGGQAGEDES